MNANELREFMRACHNLAADACTKGEYKHNQTPYLAALNDSKTVIRIGACSIIFNLWQSGLVAGPSFVVKLLKQHRDKEENALAKAIMSATIENLLTLEKKKGEKE